MEFLRRFVQHVLPDSLHKIRHYGVYAGVNSAKLAVARSALACRRDISPATVNVAALSWPELLLAVTGHDVTRCPRCGTLLEYVPVVASARAPPAREAA